MLLAFSQSCDPSLLDGSFLGNFGGMTSLNSLKINANSQGMPHMACSTSS